jgi:hypothetical protein
LNSNFSFQIYSSVHHLPPNWDTLTINNIFLSTDYLNLLEVSAPKNMTCHFIGLFNDSELVGIALSQFINLSDVTSFGERDNCIKTKIRNIAFKNLSSNVLVIGNNMLTGQNGYSFSEKLPYKEGLLLLNQVATELQNEFKNKKSNVHLTIFKDISET